MGFKTLMVAVFLALWILWPSMRSVRRGLLGQKAGLVVSTLWILVGLLVLFQILGAILQRLD